MEDRERNPCPELWKKLRANAKPRQQDDGNSQEPIVIVRDHEAIHKCNPGKKYG